MATGSNRDVTLKLGVKVDGSEDVSGLAGDVTDLAAAGKAVAPEFAKVAAELAAAAAATKEFRTAEAALEAEVKAGKQALTEQREALQRTRLTTSEADKATDAYKASVKAAALAILDARGALRDKAAALQQAATAARVAAAAEAKLGEQMRATTVGARQQSEAAHALAGDLQGVGQQLRTIQQLAGAAIGGQLLGGMVGDVAKTADAYANLSARIKLATGDGDAFESTFQGVFDIAQRTGSAVEQVGDLFTKLAQAGKSLGVTNTQTLALVESITQATQLSGTSADSANAALVQLSQAMASGVLRGEELNSILEQAPRLALALADGLGVTTGELRKLGEAGALTSAQVIGALQGQSAALRAEFEQLPPTIGRAITNLSSAWTQYVGEVDKATGASATIAGAITVLARNLDTVASVLFSVGKATAAYQALKLAQTFLGIGTATRVATTELAAYTAAQTAASTASAGTAANVGRLAGLMGTLKAFGLVAVITNLKEIGTAIGEQIAKWQGYGDKIRDAEGRMRAQEAAARSLAEANASLAQQAAIAADKALGLGVEAHALVGAFEKARQAGDTVADSLGKVTKALDLSNVQGINAAGAALDALAVRGKITGDQLRDALAAALKTEDLGKFQAEATAAFDGSEAGARRLAAAVDALGEESLRRAGLSVAELKTGFGAAAASAMNDVDALSATFDRLGAKGPETGAALARALDKATEAAGTERALRGVIDRLVEFGKSGRLSGEQVAAGLETARAKIDSLQPGVNTLREALRDFGIKSSEEMQATAARFAESWRVIKESVTTSLDDKIAAFEKYAAAAIAANKGVETSEIALQREMLRTQQIALQSLRTPTGAPIQQQRNGSSNDTPRTEQQQGNRDPNDPYKPNVHVVDHNVGRAQSVLGNTRDERLAGQNVVDASLQFKIRDKLQAGILTADDLPEIQAVIASLDQQKAINNSASKLSAGFQSTVGIADAQAWQAMRQQLAGFIDALKRKEQAQSFTVNVNMPGQRTRIGVASPQEANKLADLLGQLGQARRVS